MLFNKPEYFWNPRQIIKRVFYRYYARKNADRRIQLPWGDFIRVNLNETIGRCLYTQGVYHLDVSEIILRLVKPGDRCIDAGANIGYISMLMSYCCGSKGKVYSFEPHPDIFKRLSQNMTYLEKELKNFQLFNVALSDVNGKGHLYLPPVFAINEGTAKMVNAGTQENEGHVMEVVCDRIDRCVKKESIKLLKMDVEGHELQALMGAEEFLKACLIQNVIYEDDERYPAKISGYLESFGYTVYKIGRSFTRPVLTAPGDHSYDLPYEPHNYLAVRDTSFLEELREKGWKIYRNK